MKDRDIAAHWWPFAGLSGPFTPGNLTGGNDGIVRDAQGQIVADCRGYEARADVIAALLNGYEYVGCDCLDCEEGYECRRS